MISQQQEVHITFPVGMQERFGVSSDPYSVLDAVMAVVEVSDIEYEQLRDEHDEVRPLLAEVYSGQTPFRLKDEQALREIYATKGQQLAEIAKLKQYVFESITPQTFYEAMMQVQSSRVTR